MALDYFRSVPARLQQRGLQGLATDQREIDADAQRRKEEEERARQLEQIKAQYDEATAQATQQAQGLTLRDSILGQARERFEELTGGVGQAASDLGTAVRGGLDQAGQAASDLGEARDAFVQQPARAVADQAGAAVGNAIGQYGDWREEIQARPEPSAAGLEAERQEERAQAAQRPVPPQDPITQALAPFREQQEAEREAPEAKRAQQEWEARQGRERLAPWEGTDVSGPVEGVARTAAALGEGAARGWEKARRIGEEQIRTGAGFGTQGEGLPEQAQALFGGAMGPYGVLPEAAKGAVEEATGSPLAGAAAYTAAGLLGPGGPKKFLEEGLPAAGKLIQGARSGGRAGLAEAARELGGVGTARAAATGAGVVAAPIAGGVATKIAADQGLSPQEAAAAGLTTAGDVLQITEAADIPIGLGRGAARGAAGVARGALGRAGQITPDMSLGEGLRGAAGTARAQAGAVGRGIAEGPLGRLAREERGELGRAQPEPAGDTAALQAELKEVNQARAQAAQALGKARLKVGPPDKPPAGLTPETQGIWDAYATSARRAQQIQTEISRAKQGATQAAETQLGEPTGRPPEGLPVKGRGSWQDPGVTYGRGQQGDMTWAPQADMTQGAQAPFFSALQRAVQQLPAGRLAPNQLARQLLAQPDVKKEQLVWSGVEDYLTEKLKANNGRGEAVTKEELGTWLQEHDVRVYEVQKGQATPVDANERARLDYEQRSLQNQAEDAQQNLGMIERDAEEAAFQILGPVQERLRQSGQVDETVGLSSLDQVAAQVMFGYPNLPKDRPFFQALEAEAQQGDGFIDPVLAATTPAERAQLEAIRQEWQDADQAHTAALDALDQTETALRASEGQTLPGGPTKWVDYADGGLNLPGIEEPDANPREFLLTLGPRSDMPSFTEGHWDEPNVIAHIRMSSRMTPDGKRVLMIEELQSDWHQKGRAVVKDSAGKPVIDPETGKPKRRGYYPGRRDVEEMRASPEYAERARLTQAVTEASAAREEFHRSGRLEDAKRALRFIQAAGYEVAIEKARAAGIPEELLPSVNESSKLLDRARTSDGFGSVAEPTVLVKSWGTDTTGGAEILDWAPGFTRYGDPEEAQTTALIERAREMRAEESRMWTLAGERGEQPSAEAPRYEYLTRPLYQAIHDMAGTVTEVRTARRAADAVEAEFRALDKAYDDPTRALSNLNAQYGDLSQVDATDRQRAVQARIAELEADPDIRSSPRYWTDRISQMVDAAQRADPSLRSREAHALPDVQAVMAEAREATGGQQTVEAAQRALSLAMQRVTTALRDQSYEGAQRGPYDPFAADAEARRHPAVQEAMRRLQEAEQGARHAPPEAEKKYDTLRKLQTEQRNLASSLEYGAQRHYPAGRPPAGPFQGEGWQRLALKRMLHLASTEGFDFLGLTPGEVHAFRYDPFRGMGVEALEYYPATGKLTIDLGDQGGLREETVKPDELHLYVGNEVADALLDPARARQGGGVAVIRKEDWIGGLDVESEMGVGQRKGYDQILPGLLSDLGRRFGAEVRIAPQTDPQRALLEGGLESGILLYPGRDPAEMVLERGETGERRERPNFQPAHLIEVTPEMRQAMAEPGAQPLFQITPGGAMSGAGTAGGALSEGAAALEEEEGEELTPEERLKRGLAGVGTGALIGGLGTRRGRRALSRGGDVLRLLNQEETGGIKLKPLPGPITGPVTAFGQPARGVDPETGEPRAAPPTAGERFREGQGIAQPYGAFEPESPEAQVTDAMDAKAEQAETAGAGLAQVREAEAAYARDGDTEALKAATDAYYPSPDELEILPGAPPTVHKYGGARSFFDLLRFLDAGKEGLNWYETMSGKLRGQTAGRPDIWQESLAFFGRTGQRTTPEVNHELTFAAILARDDLDKAGQWPLVDGEEGAAVLRKAMRPYIGLTSGPEAGSVDAAAVRTEIEARKERQAKAPDEDPEKAPRTPEEDEAVADGDADGDDLDIPEVGADGDPNVPTTGKVLQALIQMWNTGETSIDKNLKLASYTEALTGPARGRLAMTSVPDVWMFFAFGFEDTGKIASDPEASRYVQAVVKRLADERGLAPAQAQAAIWTGARKLAESDPDLQREVFKRFEIPKREKNVLAAETKATQARFARAITPPIQRITEPLLRGEEKQAYRELSQARAPQQQTRALSQRSVEEAQSAHAQAKADVAAAREAVKAAGKDTDAKAQAKQGVVEALARQDEAKAAMGEAREAHKAVLEGTAGPVKDAEKAYQAKRREMLKAMGGVKLRRGAEGEPALPGGPPTPSGATHQAVTEAEAKIRAAQTETLNRKPPATIYSTAKRYRLNGYEGDIPDLKTPQGLAEWLGKTGTPASVEKANEALLAHVKERLPDLAPPPREMTVAHRTEQLKGLPYRQEPATVEAGARRAEQQGRRINVSSPFHTGSDFTNEAVGIKPPPDVATWTPEQRLQKTVDWLTKVWGYDPATKQLTKLEGIRHTVYPDQMGSWEEDIDGVPTVATEHNVRIVFPTATAAQHRVLGALFGKASFQDAAGLYRSRVTPDDAEVQASARTKGAPVNNVALIRHPEGRPWDRAEIEAVFGKILPGFELGPQGQLYIANYEPWDGPENWRTPDEFTDHVHGLIEGAGQDPHVLVYFESADISKINARDYDQTLAGDVGRGEGGVLAGASGPAGPTLAPTGGVDDLLRQSVEYHRAQGWEIPDDWESRARAFFDTQRAGAGEPGGAPAPGGVAPEAPKPPGATVPSVLRNLGAVASRLAGEETGSLTLPGMRGRMDEGLPPEVASAPEGTRPQTPFRESTPPGPETPPEAPEAPEAPEKPGRFAPLRDVNTGINSVVRASALSSPLTLVRNIAQGAVGAAEQPLERFIAAGLDDLIAKVRTDTSARAGEKVTVQEAGAMARASLGGLGKAMRGGIDAVTGKSEQSDLGKTQGVSRMETGAGKKFEKVTDVAFSPTKFINGFFNALSEHVETAGLSARGVAGKALKERATEAATYRSLQSEMDAIGKAMSKVAETPLVGPALMPFFKTPYNAVKYGLERMPVTSWAITARKFADKEASTAEVAEQAARAVYGTALWAGFLGLAYATDRITGAEPANQTEREEWQAEGKQPYSVRLGDRWVSFALFPAIHDTLVAAAATGDVLRQVQHPEEQDDDAVLGSVFTNLLTIGREAVQRPVFGGLTDLLDAMDDPERNGPRLAESLVGNLASAVVAPAAGRYVADVLDPYERATSGVQERLMRGQPGQREQLPKARTHVGDVRDRDTGVSGAIGRALNPLKTTRARPGREFYEYRKAESAKEDRLIRQAKAKVDRYKRAPDEHPEPTNAEYDWADLAARSTDRDPEFDKYRGEEDKERRLQQQDAAARRRKSPLGGLLGGYGRGGGGLPSRPVTGPAALLLRGGR